MGEGGKFGGEGIHREIGENRKQNTERTQKINGGKNASWTVLGRVFCHTTLPEGTRREVALTVFNNRNTGDNPHQELEQTHVDNKVDPTETECTDQDLNTWHNKVIRRNTGEQNDYSTKQNGHDTHEGKLGPGAHWEENKHKTVHNPDTYIKHKTFNNRTNTT